jgi:hypothetical protein
MLTLETPLTAIPPGSDGVFEVEGADWTVHVFLDGALLIERSRASGAILPPHAAAELRTVGDVVRAVVEAGDRYATLGRVVIALLHGVHLAAPVYPRIAGGARQAWVRPVDDGLSYVCRIDPEPRWPRPSDGSAFDAALAFVNQVGLPSAEWALSRARLDAEDARRLEETVAA